MRPDTANGLWPARRALHCAVAVLLVCLTAGGCDYGRMKDDEAINTYQTAMPVMDARTVPVTDGLQLLQTTDPDTLVNPISMSRESIDRGKEAYGYYCAQCHGLRADGYGTVGQSFAPLPTDLRKPYVQNQTDGMLFYRISLGYKREPPLADTVAPEDRWAIINYIRSIAEPQDG